MSNICSCSGYFMAYSDGTQVVTATPVVLNLNQEIVKDLGQYTHITGSGFVQVKSDGLYEINYGANFTKSGISTGPCEVVTEIYQNANKIPGSIQFATIVNSVNPDIGTSASTMAWLTDLDQLSLRAGKITNLGAIVDTIPSGVWLSVTRLA